MKKYKVTVTRVDQYEIEIDETIYNEEWIENFERYFHSLDGEVEEIASDIAIHQARFGKDGGGFIEGFGYVTRNGELPHSFEDFDKDGKWLPEDQRRKPTPGLNIIIIDEDDDIETDVEEIEEE